MLGRQHILLSIETVTPFLIPFIFLGNDSLIQYGFAFFIAVFIGSLTPDADCRGKASIYYKFPLVDKLMKRVIIKIVNLFFKIPKIKDKIKEGYEVKEEHRGIMHAPIGILISSFILTIILSIFLIVFTLFNFIFVIVIFFGLLIGQFLHILEDSTTITGINWKFPFGDKKIQGEINTWNKEDPRPKIYSFILGAISIILLLGYSFNKINFSLWILYPALLILITLLWVIFLKISIGSNKSNKIKDSSFYEGDELEAEAKKGEIKFKKKEKGR